MIKRLTATFLVKDAHGALHEVSEVTAFEASTTYDLRPMKRRYVDADGRVVYRVSDSEFESAAGVQLTIV